MHDIKPSKHARRHPNSLRHTNIWAFGFGSLLAVSGIRGRGMWNLYKPSDLTECLLNGYRRELNATIHGYDEEYQLSWSSRYYGITRQPGAQTNGVVFPIAAHDIDPFVRSEGGDRLYAFVDVTSDLVFAGPSPLKTGDQVYACVVRRPDKTGYVSKLYIEKCRRALSARSPSFQAAFGTLESYL